MVSHDLSHDTLYEWVFISKKINFGLVDHFWPIDNFVIFSLTKVFSQKSISALKYLLYTSLSD